MIEGPLPPPPIPPPSLTSPPPPPSSYPSSFSLTPSPLPPSLSPLHSPFSHLSLISLLTLLSSPKLSSSPHSLTPSLFTISPFLPPFLSPFILPSLLSSFFTPPIYLALSSACCCWVSFTNRALQARRERLSTLYRKDPIKHLLPLISSDCLAWNCAGHRNRTL